MQFIIIEHSLINLMIKKGENKLFETKKGIQV